MMLGIIPLVYSWWLSSRFDSKYSVYVHMLVCHGKKGEAKPLIHMHSMQYWYLLVFCPSNICSLYDFPCVVYLVFLLKYEYMKNVRW